MFRHLPSLPSSPSLSISYSGMNRTKLLSGILKDLTVEWKRHYVPSTVTLYYQDHGKSTDISCIIWGMPSKSVLQSPFHFSDLSWPHTLCGAYSRKRCQGVAHDMGTQPGPLKPSQAGGEGDLDPWEPQWLCLPIQAGPSKGRRDSAKGKEERKQWT